ncbi:unnamed protein product [Echinostoma caproni]|uniref:Phospholipase D3 n=1 Tax=Echinostoma caproni TaxID=27848 RepID=A0A183A910_9TREM|nr:unnamed protein product [Echinostoma caproni]
MKTLVEPLKLRSVPTQAEVKTEELGIMTRKLGSLATRACTFLFPLFGLFVATLQLCDAYLHAAPRPVTTGRSEATLPWSQDEVNRLTRTPHCQVILVESMPENLTYSMDAPRHASTYFSWNLLLSQATESVSIASFYWSLLAEPKYNASAVTEGRNIFEQLLEKSGKLNVTIAQSGPRKNDTELEQLEAAGATIYWVDVAKLLGRGIIHTKLWTVDNRHGYLGSANMDWRSLTEVKELGVLFLNCPLFVEDLNKIHKGYCAAADSIPREWPSDLITQYNRSNPMRVSINGFPSLVHLSASPKEFNPPGRSFDLDTILDVINKAEKFIHISVMDYSPEIVSYDQHLRSEEQQLIPHARVNHNKYMVTDKTAYIGTSNWSGDYFLYTGGAAFVVEEDRSLPRPDEEAGIPHKSIRDQLVDIFRRDWNSEYTFEQ